MDNQFYKQTEPFSRRSAKLESAAFICGILSLLTICLVYPALICGALSITFALLSRGGETKMSQRAQAGLIMGCAALFIIISILIYTITIAYTHFGGIEEMLREMYRMMGLDYDAILSNYSR